MFPVLPFGVWALALAVEERGPSGMPRRYASLDGFIHRLLEVAEWSASPSATWSTMSDCPAPMLGRAAGNAASRNSAPLSRASYNP